MIRLEWSRVWLFCVGVLGMWLGVGDCVEQFGGLFGVVYCVVCFVGVLVEFGGVGCVCQYGLVVGDVGQSYCVEYVEGMEWIVFVVGVVDCGIDEVQVEMCVVVDQDCVLVVVFFYGGVDWCEDVVECVFFRFGQLEWVVEDDVGYFQ